jgi:DNA replication protein DnaC
MFKLSEIAPAIAAELEAHEKAMAEHRETCREHVCMKCGRVPPRPERVPVTFEDFDRSYALDTVPEAFRCAALDSDWLAKLVGGEDIERAAQAIGAKRAAFIGPPGAGKTSLAAAMFRAAVAQAKGRVVRGYRWCSSHALAKARATSGLGEEAPLVEKALMSPLLVIDELGGEDPRHASAVAEVLYERHAENRATWVTTGVSPKAIADRYGGGIARRVFEGAEVFRLGTKK